MKSLIAFLLLCLGASQASACITYSAEVRAKVRGAKIENNMCVALATIREIAPSEQCGLNLKENQTVWIKIPAELLENGCPKTRNFFLEGTVMSVGQDIWLQEGQVFH